jgi:hypothetical protein
VPPSTSWRKSSFSEGPQTNCVEVALAESRAAVRDSKNAAGPVLTVSATAWRAFVTVACVS